MSKKLVIILSIVAVFVILLFSGIIWFVSGTKPVNKNNSDAKIIEIKSGTKTEEILELLVENKIIKNKYSAALYMKLNGVKGLQAGTYQLQQSMSLKDILNKISSGEVYDETVKITFIEGRNMRWIASKIAEQTKNTEEDVYSLLQDTQYVQSLIQKYWFLTDTITNQNIYYSLEGYLYPDTYEFENPDVSVKEIFNIILNKTDKILSNYKSQIEARGLNVHQVLTIASIIELEGNDTEARHGIASVIYNRLNKNMSLGSDVTAYYAAKKDMSEGSLTTNELNASNPYNTRGPGMNGKLPIGPICNPSEEAINAALNPSQTDDLYFVADTSGKVYFTKTYEQHQQIIQELQRQGIWGE